MFHPQGKKEGLHPLSGEPSLVPVVIHPGRPHHSPSEHATELAEGQTPVHSVTMF